jgi:Tfp pilus assembly protein PilO
MHLPAVRRLAAEIVPITVLSGALLLCATIARFALVPEVTAFRGVAAQLDYFKSLLSDTNRYQAIKDGLADKQNRLQNKLGKATSQSDELNPRGLSELLQLLITRAGRADIRFVKMLPQQELARGERIEFPVVLETTTSYHSLGQFVSSIEELPAVLRIERMAITAQKADLDVKILLTCFYRKAQ